MKYLIVGRTGSGKDVLREALESRLGWTFVKSYTTRTPRYPGEDTHEFVSSSDSRRLSKEKAAQTFIKNGPFTDEYFATYDQIRSCKGYIVDPVGLECVLNDKKLSDVNFYVVYAKASSNAKRYLKCLKRNGAFSFAKTVARVASERKQFCKFEKYLRSLSEEDSAWCYVWVNSYRPEDVDRAVRYLEAVDKKF